MSTARSKPILTSQHRGMLPELIAPDGKPLYVITIPLQALKDRLQVSVGIGWLQTHSGSKTSRRLWSAKIPSWYEFLYFGREAGEGSTVPVCTNQRLLLPLRLFSPRVRLLAEILFLRRQLPYSRNARLNLADRIDGANWRWFGCRGSSTCAKRW